LAETLRQRIECLVSDRERRTVRVLRRSVRERAFESPVIVVLSGGVLTRGRTDRRRCFLNLRPASRIETRAIECTGFEPLCEFVDDERTVDAVLRKFEVIGDTEERPRRRFK